VQLEPKPANLELRPASGQRDGVPLSNDWLVLAQLDPQEIPPGST